jgi:hypothetical protein
MKIMDYKDTNAKCRLYWCFIELSIGDTVSHVGIFDPGLGTVVPLPFSLVHLPPSQSRSTVRTDSVWLGGGGEVLSCVGDHILQEFNTLFLTRFRIRTYKIARPLQTKT